MSETNSNEKYQGTGGMWKKVSKAGNNYYGCNLICDRDYKKGERLEFSAFKNEKKEKENHPDIILKINKPREEQQQSTKDDALPF
jgi:hypothetical protein